MENKSRDVLFLYIDGAARGNPGPAGIGLVLFDEEEREIESYNEFIGVKTNNFAEYTALKIGLEKAKKYKPLKLTIFSDSELLVSHLTGKYKVRSSNLLKIFQEVKEKIKDFNQVKIKNISREENFRADKLANQAIDNHLNRNEKEGIFELTVKSHFDAAHFLRGYPGECSKLHGHTWEVEVTIGGRKLNEIEILYDFRDLKQELKKLLNKFDHKYLNEIPPFDNISPTGENLARQLFYEIEALLPSGIFLKEVSVWESPEAKVTYHR